MENFLTTQDKREILEDALNRLGLSENICILKESGECKFAIAEIKKHCFSDEKFYYKEPFSDYTTFENLKNIIECYGKINNLNNK